jgi:hypothetical protein
MITAHSALSIRRRGSSSSGKEAALPELGDADVEIPGRGRQQLRPVPVALRSAGRAALARLGADRAGQLGLDQLLQRRGQDVRDGGGQARVGAL